MKSIYQPKNASQATSDREYKHFLRTPAYYMSTCWGSVLTVVYSIVLFLFGKGMAASIAAKYTTEDEYKFAAVIFISAISIALAGLNSISAYSVSFEGKNFWILQSMPMDDRAFFDAKINLHLLIGAVPQLLPAAAAFFIFKVGPENTAYVFASGFAATQLIDLIGFILDVNNPVFDWEDESIIYKDNKKRFILFGSSLASAAILFIAGKILISKVWIRFVMLGIIILLCIGANLLNGRATKKWTATTHYIPKAMSNAGTKDLF